MDMENFEKAIYGDVETDEDLLAELLALEAEEKGKMAKIPPQQRPAVPSTKRIHEDISIPENSDALKDTSSDGLVSDGDLDDPDLLEEFSCLVSADDADKLSKVSPPTLRNAQTACVSVDNAMLKRLEGLQQNYKKALESVGDNGPKKRRYQRAVDKIQELIKKVQSGKPIDENEIPVALPVTSNAAVIGQASVPSSAPENVANPNANVSDSVAYRVGGEFTDREDAPKQSLVEPQREILVSHSVPPASLSSEVTEQVHNVHDPVPGSSRFLNGDKIKEILKERREAYLKNAQLANSANDKHAAFGFFTVVKQFDQALAMVNSGKVTECDENDLPPFPPLYKPPNADIPLPPKTLLEGLNQRLEKYKSLCEQCQRENDDRKFRMNTRIVKRYEEAILACKNRKAYAFHELPCPLGYPSLPLQDLSAPEQKPSDNLLTDEKAKVPLVKPHRIHPVVPATGLSKQSGMPVSSLQKQQIDFLLKRQLEFKQAALVARQKKDIVLAKKYLLTAKGFDSLIVAAQTGQRIDLKKVPVPPQVRPTASAMEPVIEPQPIESSFDVIEGSREDIFATLECDLIRQIKLCDENRMAFTKLGDVTRVNFFESLLRETKVDLLYLRQVAKANAAVPKFRYETRNFPFMETCADVSEDHLELSVIRVVDAKLPSGWKPSDGNIFVKYEFAFPYNAHQTGKTRVIAGTNSPEFKETNLLGINRKSKQLLRTVKRNCLKFEVYQKGGFLRSDKLLGAADCKLSSLEDKAQIHEVADLMEGRRAVGGKIEYKVRLREPLGEKKATIVQEKWLVLIKSV